MRAGWILLLSLFLVAQGCDSAENTNNSSVRGGAIGSSCGGSDTYGCTPDYKDQVVCESGKWASAGTCAEGTQCHELDDSTGALIGTECRAAAPTELKRGKGCAALAACGYALSATVCMRNSDPQVLAARIATEDRVAVDASAQVVWPENETCLAQAADCAAVRSCLVGGRTANGCAASCDGKFALGCLGQDASKELGLDCAARGLSCVTHNGQAFCAPLGNCSGTTGELTCNGNEMRYCSNGQSGMVDCSKQDGTCVASAAGASCVGKGKGCTSSASSCDGATLVRCVGNGEERIDCASNGLVCKAWSASQAECTTAAAATCTTAESCSGSQLLFCEAGKTVGIDCAERGVTCGSKGLGFACLMK